MSPSAEPDLELIVYGATGRMGGQVLQLAREQNLFKKVHPVKRFKDFSGNGDVVIDFSLPQALNELVHFCGDKKVPLVSGTTGLDENHMSSLKALAQRVPVLWSPNMSLGVMVITRCLKEMSVLSDWEFKISETHHIHKKDRPSGTAIRLREALEKAIGRTIDEPESRREGEVIGDHQIKALGPFEEISIEHRATDRRVFAQGAIQAALWIADREPGFYSLQDLLDFS